MCSSSRYTSRLAPAFRPTAQTSSMKLFAACCILFACCMVVMALDPYGSLGLTKQASDAEIKAAYRKLALKYHPDKVCHSS